MPRKAFWSIALLALVATLLTPTTESSAQGTAATPRPAPEASDSSQGSFTARKQFAAVPARGLIMEQVEERFGVPEAKLPAVGDPAITRWIYKDFTVYFEDRYVIHGVVHQ